MSKYTFLLFISLFFISTSVIAIGNIWIEPSNPTTNDIITVYVEHDPFQGYLQGEFIRTGDIIRLNLISGDPPIPGPDTVRVETYEYGTLAAGYYTFEYYIGVVPFADTFISDQSITVTPVVTQEVKSVPTLTQTSIFILFILMLVIAAWKMDVGERRYRKQ